MKFADGTEVDPANIVAFEGNPANWSLRPIFETRLPGGAVMLQVGLTAREHLVKMGFRAERLQQSLFNRPTSEMGLDGSYVDNRGRRE